MAEVGINIESDGVFVPQRNYYSSETIGQMNPDHYIVISMLLALNPYFQRISLIAQKNKRLSKQCCGAI